VYSQNKMAGEPGVHVRRKIVSGRSIWRVTTTHHSELLSLWFVRFNLFSSCGFFLLSFFFFPCLISAVADWTSTILLGYTSWCGPSANLECRSEVCCTAARWKCTTQKDRQKFAIWAPLHNFVGLYVRNEGTYWQSEKNFLNSNISICPHSMVNFGLLTAEICWRVWGIPANFNAFRVLASLLQRRHSTEVNQTLHDVWPSPGLVHYIYIFWGFWSGTEFFLRAKFTLRPSLAFSYIGSVTSRHSSSGPQRHFSASYKEWNYGTFADGATYIRLGGHHVRQRPTF